MLDSEEKPSEVPAVRPETSDEKRRYANAEVRKNLRIRVKRKTQPS